jgi:hypothetical protein
MTGYNVCYWSLLPDVSKPGRVIFAVAMAGFATLSLGHAFAAGPALGPPWTSSSPLWTYGTDAVLLVSAMAIAAGKKVTPPATLLAALLLLHGLGVYLPRLIATPRNPGPWTSAFELLAMCGAALGLAGFLARTGRFLFAASLVVFAVQHFLYAGFIANLLPGWIPAHLFWAYFVGAAFAAAALAIATGRSAVLGANLLGLMFLLWVAGLHAPRVFAARHNGNEWTSLLVALAMCGASWVISGKTAKWRLF